MTLVPERIGRFFHEDHRLEYTEYGAGDRWVVLVPGLLMPRRMHERLARRIAASGAHVVTLDLLGHGGSDRPADPMAYSATAFGEQVIALLDHLGADRAVLGGTSLGANVVLEAAVQTPGRVRGLILEMPVLDNAVEAGVLALSPLLLVSRFAPLAVSGTRVLAGAVPRRLLPFRAGLALDSLDQHPAAVRALVHGLLFGRLAPPSKARRRLDVPVLVVGRASADAALLADEIPGARFVGSRGLPVAEAIAFVAGCHDVPAQARRVGS
jgi:pimeloyl-ACP methyl ester carboxylesterase